jgi:hypothetical protein
MAARGGAGGAGRDAEEEWGAEIDSSQVELNTMQVGGALGGGGACRGHLVHNCTHPPARPPRPRS